MGGRMVPHLVAAGYEVVAFDPKDDRLEAATAAGAVAAEDARDAVRRGEVVMASLRSSAMFGEVAESDMLPHAVAGQVVLDMGTTEAAETRRLALAFAERGTTLYALGLSCQWSPRAAHARLRRRRQRGLRAVPSHLGGHSRSGAHRLLRSQWHRAGVAFGIRAGADPKAISQGVGGPEPWRQCIEDVARAAADGRADEILVKFPELPYFLREAEAQGFEAPLTRALFQFLDPCPRDWVDNMGRPRVALWSQLMAAVPVNRP
jgi:3-hydroxyisobutyrate dehydrogenase